ncbi:hypothetical protein [Streptomyces sp. H34-S4]|uniref:hypothetical protein n=1 Tax=Streptomyces sp. H34-S4 TaxID=2996463 RepID=UPI0022707962|nr:hypothetical protein [Streptomyces sp. H34-S4]MCY0938534.1 hypothetical protein [Streptomyces sp. H34-S4]
MEEAADEAGAVEDEVLEGEVLEGEVLEGEVLEGEVLEGEYVDPDPSEVFRSRIRAALVERGRLARAEDDPGIARLELGEVLADTIGLFGSDDPLTVGFGFDLACACARDELFGGASVLLGEIVPRMAALHGPEDRRTCTRAACCPGTWPVRAPCARPPGSTPTSWATRAGCSARATA